MTRRPVETVSFGMEYAGSIELTEDGYVALGPHGEAIKVCVTLADARRAVFELHRDSSVVLGRAAA